MDAYMIQTFSESLISLSLFEDSCTESDSRQYFRSWYSNLRSVTAYFYFVLIIEKGTPYLGTDSDLTLLYFISEL